MTHPRYKKGREGRRKQLTAQHAKHLIDALASALLAVPVLHRHAVANVLRRERQLWKRASARTHERIQSGRKEINALAPNLPALTPPLLASLKFGLGFAVNTPKAFSACALSLVSSPYVPLYALGPQNPDAGEVDAGESVA
jgi:hypothetical protein